VKRVAIAILNWNGEKFLRQFLPDVVTHSNDLADVYIIDNASQDGSLDYVRESLPEVRLVSLKRNFGFAGGYNKGIQEIPHEYIVLLNSDVQVTPGWIQPMIDYVDSHPKMVACQPRIRDFHKREWFEYAGAAGGFIDKDAFAFCAGRIFYEFEKDDGQYTQNEEVFWASGASLFIQREAYVSVEGLDEDFFAHMEEIDLCWRLKNRGFQIGACRNSEVYHVGGGTLDRLHPFKTYLNFRNNLYLILKNYRSGPLYLKLIRRLVLDGLAGLRFISEGNWPYFKAVLRAHGSFYRNFRMMRKKRISEAPHSMQPNLTGMYTGSIIRAFFIQKKHHLHQLSSDLFLNGLKN